MSDTTKRFEDWEKVDCNECARYWDSSCDGVSKGSQKQCNSFLATRSIVIPHRIKKLQRRVFLLSLVVFGEYVVGGIILLVGWLLGKI